MTAPAEPPGAPPDESDGAREPRAPGDIEASPATDGPIQRGFLHVHTHLSRSLAAVFEVAASTRALVELLVDKGFVSAQEVRDALARASDDLTSTDLGRGLGVVLREDAPDEHGHPDTAVIDCAARVDRCRAACCTLDVPLGAEDIREGRLRWDLARPYLLRRDARGACTHLGKDRACTVHAHRPLSCRTYSCRDDPRIWTDFEAGLANTEGIDALIARRVRITEPEGGGGG